MIQANSLPNDKILDESKFKEFADDNIILTQKLNSVLGRVENIMGKGDNAGLPAFSPFATMFSKAFFSRGVKSRDRVVKGLRDLTSCSVCLYCPGRWIS